MIDVEISRARPSWRTFCGPALTLACFIHCIGIAVLAPVLPALAQAADTPLLEWGLWSASAGTALLAVRHFDRQRARIVVATAALASCSIGIWGLTHDLERPVRVSLVGILVVQVVTMVRRARWHRALCREGHDHARE
jgi:ABC-type transport system involved in cytochrome c biogenesis permease subunit